MHEPEEAVIAIRMGFSRNPLIWVVPVIQMIAYLGVLVIAILAIRETAGVSIVILLLVVPFFVRFFKDTFFVDCTTVLFFDDRISVDLRVPRGKRNGAETHRYHDIAHLELLNLSEIRMTIVDWYDVPYTASIRTANGRAEDLFDVILDQVQASAPDHLFSIYEHGFVRFSTECEPESLFPGPHQTVNRAVVKASRVTAGDREFRIDWPVLLDDGKPILRITTGHICTPRGMVLGSIGSPAYREITIELFNEQAFCLASDRSLSLDGADIGQIVEQPGEYALELEQPLPQIIAAIIVLVFIANRSALRV